jgi:hypothetical protein
LHQETAGVGRVAEGVGLHVRFAPETAPVVVALLIVPLLTGGIGLLMSRGILKRPPLELLRAETE